MSGSPRFVTFIDFLESHIGKYIKPDVVKKSISENVVELGLLASIKIHPVVNVSRIVLYQEQIER